MKVDLKDTTEPEAIGDLATGAYGRMSRAAWDAKQACERITHHHCDPLKEIVVAEAALAEAARHARALKDYRRRMSE